jgi:DNA-binding NarL/FixJ family response regulator
LTLRVWIVDDSLDVANSLTELLSLDASCRVVGHASSEQQALDWSFQNDAGFDVAILDLLLNEGSGFAVLSHLAKYQPGKVVVLSEYVSPAIAQRCLSMGAVATFAKSQMAECIRYVKSVAADGQLGKS